VEGRVGWGKKDACLPHKIMVFWNKKWPSHLCNTCAPTNEQNGIFKRSTPTLLFNPDSDDNQRPAQLDLRGPEAQPDVCESDATVYDSRHGMSEA
jgi:hypothetical protein